MEGASPELGEMEELEWDTPQGLQGTCSNVQPPLLLLGGTPVCPVMPLTTPKGQFSISIAPAPASPSVCRAARCGSNPCLGEGLRAGVRGAF